MNAKENLVLTWPDKENVVPMNTAAPDTIKDLIFPFPLTEKTLFVPEITERSQNPAPLNRCFQGDNLEVMQQLIAEGYENALDLIYIDPPYMSASNYHAKAVMESQGGKQTVSRLAFADTWNYDSKNYLTHIYPRLKVMYKLLKENGSIFVHLDWHISHYVKILLDEIFTPEAFINEIVWCYSGGSGAGRHFQRKHDVILWYVKGPDYIFNPQYRPYTEGTVQRGLTRVKGDKYQLNKKGANLQDWWADINKILSPTARENLKYPTQKPVNLIKRIIASASNPGSLVADFYAGSGTTAAVCEQMKRQWICCDSSQLAVDTMLSRLIQSKSLPFTREIIDKEIDENNSLLEIEVYEMQKFTKEIEVSINIKTFIPERLPDNITCNSSAAFIHFWEIDLNYNGKNFCSDVQIFRKTMKFDDSLCLDIILRIPARNFLIIAVRVHDLWGNITTKTVTISP